MTSTEPSPAGPFFTIQKLVRPPPLRVALVAMAVIAASNLAFAWDLIPFPIEVGILVVAVTFFLAAGARARRYRGSVAQMTAEGLVCEGSVIVPLAKIEHASGEAMPDGRVTLRLHGRTWANLAPAPQHDVDEAYRMLGLADGTRAHRVHVAPFFAALLSGSALMMLFMVLPAFFRHSPHLRPVLDDLARLAVMLPGVVTAYAGTRRVVVGSDGVRIERLLSTTYVPYADVLSVTARNGDVTLVRASRSPTTIGCTPRDFGGWIGADALARLIQERLERFRAARETTDEATRAAVTAFLSSGQASTSAPYRDAPVPTAQLLAVAEDATADLRVRVAASEALTRLGTDHDRERLAQAAAMSAAPEIGRILRRT